MGLFPRGQTPGILQDVIPETVRSVLADHGLEALEFEPGSTPTAATAAARIGVETARIAKSILLKAKDGRFVMAVIPGDARLDNGKIKAWLGCRARMATAEETLEATGFRPGGVCPFGIGDLPVAVDRSLDRFDIVYPAAGTDATGVPVSPGRLARIVGADRADLIRIEPAAETI